MVGSKLILSCVVSSAVVASAALRCDLAMQRGTAGSACLDPSALKGASVRVPSNVTRIGRDGLALCTQKTSANLATDIEYVIDNSASMSSKVFWVDPATVATPSPDTSWYIQDCYEVAAISGAASKVALRKRHFGGTGAGVLGWDTLYQVPSAQPRPSVTSGTKCKESNDPYSYRAEAVNQAIRYQASLDSSAQAGMIQFNTKVTQAAALRPLSGAGYARLLDSAGLYPAASGTKWAGPLDTAFKRLKASPNAQKAIIMVSDGEPDDESAYPTVIAQAGFPKVYGIYLGAADASVPEMTNLTKTTGGRFWIVPPDRPDSLQSVIRAIVGSLNTVSTPASTVLRNLTNGQGAKALSLLERADSTFQLQLDSVIALGAGKNSLQLVSTWTDDKGKLNADTTAFVLDVSATAATAGDTAAVLGDTLFATVCSQASRLSLLDPSRAEVPYLTEGMGGFWISLAPSGTLPASGNHVTVRELRRGDVETLASLSAAAGVYQGTLALHAPRPWKDVAGTVDADDGLDTLVASWCYPRDGRDCAEDTIQVQSFVSPWVAFEQSTWTGPIAAMGVKASLPGIGAGEPVLAKYWLRGRLLVTRNMRLGADSLYHDTLKVRQGSSSGDTLPILKPGLEDSIVVTVDWSVKGTTVADTARILRPTLALEMTALGRDSVALTLSAGAQAGLDGRWNLRLVTPDGEVAVSLDSRTARMSVLELLAGSLTSPVSLRAVFVDPLYRDSAADTLAFTVPLRSLQFSAASVEGPRGQLSVSASDPWVTGSSLVVKLLHGVDTVSLTLARTLAGDFLGSIPFSQARSAGPDTLVLGPPMRAGGRDSVVALLPGDGIHPSLRDTAWVLRPAFGLVLSSDSSRAFQARVGLTGATADSLGRVVVQLDRPQAIAVPMEGAGRLRWNGSADLSGLDESRDSATVRGYYADPLYGDTAWAALRLASPWYPGRLVASPDTLDPRRGDSVWIVVTDRDPDSGAVDTVVVGDGTRGWLLPETGKATGEYRLRLAARDLDTTWASRPARTPWTVVLTTIDRRHLQDTARDTVRLSFRVPPPQLTVPVPVAEVRTGLPDPTTPERVSGGKGIAVEMLADTALPVGAHLAQGVLVRLWERADVALYVYDMIGTYVTSWRGSVVPKDAAAGALALVRWDGRDADGRPAVAGVYVVRVVAFGADGHLVSNDLVHIGLR